VEVDDRRVVIADVDYYPNDADFTDEERAEYARLADKFLTIPYCPWQPNPGPQERALLDFGRESLYGGAVGGSKSVGIMMEASQFLDVPGYDALLLRKTFMDLGRPGALMDLANEWWNGQPGVKFDTQKHTYRFDCYDAVGQPGFGKRQRQHIGYSRIEFGGLDTENDRLKYQGGRYHFVGFDELTQFKERDYTYLFSRQRRTTSGPTSFVPIRMRSTSNPGGPGHEWVYKRFIVMWERWIKGLGPRPRRNFHPALLRDNPHLDEEDYVASLMELDPVTRAQLLRGDWNIRPDGRMFKRSWFKPVRRDEVPGDCVWVRFWDMAGTDAVPGLDPDWTVGCLMGRSADGRFYIADVRRWRKDPGVNDDWCKQTAIHDTRRVVEAMEQEPGAGGKVAIHHYRTGAFAGTGLRAVPASGKSRGRTTTITAGRKTPPAKILAAGPLASNADAGLVHIVVDGTWEADEFLSEFEIFPDGDHDDQVDAASGAHNLLAKMQSVALDLTGAHHDLGKTNPWRPDAVKNWNMADDMEARIAGARIGSEIAAAQEREVAGRIEQAFSV